MCPTSTGFLEQAVREVALIGNERAEIAEDEEVTLPDGTTAVVLDVYDDEHGKDGGVIATLVVED